MQKQVVIDNDSELLKSNGHLNVKGYQTNFKIIYNRENIKKIFRIKEWDFYQILNNEYCLQMTIGHISYIGTISATLFSLATKERWSISRLVFFPMNTFNMERSPVRDHVLSWKRNKFAMTFDVKSGKRQLKLEVMNKDIFIDLSLESNIINDKMVIATPFASPNQFYLNFKQNDFIVSGKCKFGIKEVEFLKEDTFGLLDWGRGVWPTRHQWYWGSATFWFEDRLISFNIGCGFGDLSYATENMVFINGKCLKIDEVKITIDDYLKPWVIKSNDGKLDLVLKPIYDNFTKTNLLFINNKCHQVFGLYSGFITLDNGEIIEIINKIGFCEHAVNRW